MGDKYLMLLQLAGLIALGLIVFVLGVLAVFVGATVAKVALSSYRGE